MSGCGGVHTFFIPTECRENFEMRYEPECLVQQCSLHTDLEDASYVLNHFSWKRNVAHIILFQRECVKWFLRLNQNQDQLLLYLTPFFFESLLYFMLIRVTCLNVWTRAVNTKTRQSWFWFQRNETIWVWASSSLVKLWSQRSLKAPSITLWVRSAASPDWWLSHKDDQFLPLAVLTTPWMNNDGVAAVWDIK